MATDEELLLAWRGGDNTAGDQLIARYFDPICRFFRSKLGDDVEDLIQRTFFDCLESKQRIHAPSFRSWLFGVARHRLFDHLRRSLARGGDEDLGARSLTDLRTRPSERVARAQTREIVARAMQTLPLDFQIVLELAYWEDLDGPEIAAVLGIGANTVRSRLARGRAGLREALRTAALDPAELAAGLAALPRGAVEESTG
ncbi:MAG: sigma-70 family RNA polymerase sigma factor [Nannocystaceae bacterium]|nr:sigma-70 family RNA polymerase sigma factor [Nannocystaceae bacterium]